MLALDAWIKEDSSVISNQKVFFKSSPIFTSVVTKQGGCWCQLTLEAAEELQEDERERNEKEGWMLL